MKAGVLTSLCAAVFVAAGSSKAASDLKAGARETTSEAASAPVQVYVSKQTVGGGVRYHYRVANGSAFPIKGLTVGYDRETAQAYLNLLPAGWTEDSGTPSSSLSAPQGWSSQFTPTEEDSLGMVEWTTMDDSKALLGGQSASGFEVLVPQADNGYESGHWTVYTMSPDTPSYSGVLVAEMVSPTGVIAGRVTDEHGKPIQYCSMTVLGLARGVATDADGKYSISNVPIGTYTVRCKMFRFVRQDRDSVHVSGRHTTILNVKLRPQPPGHQDIP